MTVAQTCFSASSCGLNSLCDPTLKQCVCVSNFQQANVADHCGTPFVFLLFLYAVALGFICRFLFYLVFL